MPTFEDLLTPTRTHARRGYYYTPCPSDCPADGRLEITKGKKSTAYLLAEGYAAPGYAAGRAFTLRKTDGTTYHLFLADDRTASTCDCPAHAYKASERADARRGDRFDTLGCCHLDAVASLVGNGWLPESRADAGADVATTEADDQTPPEPELFPDHPGPSADPDGGDGDHPF